MKKGILLLIISCIFFGVQKVHSAESITFESGIFSRTISIKDLESFARTGSAHGTLKNLLFMSNQNPENIVEILNEKVELPIVLTSKLMYSTIGEVVLERLAKILYPKRNPNPEISIPAIRSAVITGLSKGDGYLTLIEFLKSYPNNSITVNIPKLLETVDKAESMSELIGFFSDSPLEALKETNPEEVD